METDSSQELRQRGKVNGSSNEEPEKPSERHETSKEQTNKVWDTWNTLKKEFSVHDEKVRSAQMNGNGKAHNADNDDNKRTWCSLHTPMSRRLQTAMVAWHLSAFILLPVLAIYGLANPFLWFFSVPYLIYFMLDKAPGRGDVIYRSSTWFRSLKIWNYLCDYFPMRLYKTVDLQPTFTSKNNTVDDKQAKRGIFKAIRAFVGFPGKDTELEVTGPRYIFGYHPHGIGAIGAFGVFATEALHWTKLFPGIPVSLMTLVTQFQLPLYRDYLLALGISAVSKKNILKVLERNHSVCIVVGGARESLASSIGHVDLILDRRKGFIKLALQTGNVSLVPVFAFGETDLYNIAQTSEDSFSRKVQLWIKKNYGFTIPLFYARGMFNYDFGFLPYRRPINVVIGKPIYVSKKMSNPGDEELNYYHQRYIEELKKLYYENREKFGYSGIEINIVG